jgi:hypothetical protein
LTPAGAFGGCQQASRFSLRERKLPGTPASVEALTLISFSWLAPLSESGRQLSLKTRFGVMQEIRHTYPPKKRESDNTSRGESNRPG